MKEQMPTPEQKFEVTSMEELKAGYDINLWPLDPDDLAAVDKFCAECEEKARRILEEKGGLTHVDLEACRYIKKGEEAMNDL